MTSIDIVRRDDNPHETVHGIRDDTSSRGVDLEGATITATYADGTTETLVWQALDPYTFGGATGTDIDMSFGFEWHELSTDKLLTTLEIDLQPASSVFDTTFEMEDDSYGGSTPSSLNGFPFKLAPEYETMSGGLTVTYSGVVNLTGRAAVGDLYTTMVVDFTDLPPGGLLGDLRWNSDIDTMKAAGDLKPSGVRCFARGTLITTDRGELPVEALKTGYKVLTQDHGFQDLVLTMSRIVGAKDLRNNPKLYPIRIKADALGAGIPKRDLLVSRQHRVAVKSDVVKSMFGAMTVLVAAIRLTELPGIYVEDTVECVEYFHLVFKRHEIIFAQGTPTESFLINAETQKMLGAAFVAHCLDAGDTDGFAEPACLIPSRRAQKKLVRRHIKNTKRLLAV
ncbi:Hint domain-containing protein [Pseudorhodobacter aquimaris]|uniref:Hint domain-containing protein n=1 Tax=Pseudorhodobacter aquimaris TaxID=687412 RepID=UPI00067AA0AC|nr:Hint domain-containing protein [Pseudorhodobacter aquimaris]